MSAGPFEKVNYKLDNGKISYVRAQPEDYAAVFHVTSGATVTDVTNAAPAGTRDFEGPPPRVGGSSRIRNCVHARKVRIQFPATPPAGYKANGFSEFPVFDRAVYGQISTPAPVTATYLGVVCTVVGTIPEITRK